MIYLVIRTGRAEDIAPLDALLARSCPRLLAADYPPSILVAAVPRIVKAQPALVTCSTYLVALQGGNLMGVGGWTRMAPGAGMQATSRLGHIRHFATDVNAVPQGLGNALMERVFETAMAAGMEALACLSTRTAAPSYRRAGFRGNKEVNAIIDMASLFLH